MFFCLLGGLLGRIDYLHVQKLFPNLIFEPGKIKKIDGPGCFGECRGVTPEYFHGIFEEFWKVENSKIENWSKPVQNAFEIIFNVTLKLNIWT